MDYDAIKKKLHIDILRIDQELTEMPFLIQEAAEVASEVFNEVQRANLTLDIVKAETADAMRQASEGNKALSETRIASELILDPKVQEMQRKLNDLKYDAKLINDLVSNLRDKSRLLGKVSDMILAGFISPNSKHSFAEDAKTRANRKV